MGIYTNSIFYITFIYLKEKQESCLNFEEKFTLKNLKDALVSFF